MYLSFLNILKLVILMLLIIQFLPLFRCLPMTYAQRFFFFLLKGSFFFVATVGCFGGQTLGICKALSDTFDCNRHYLNKAD